MKFLINHVLSVKSLHENKNNAAVNVPVPNLSKDELTLSAEKFASQGEEIHMPEHLQLDMPSILQQMQMEKLKELASEMIEAPKLRDKIVQAISSVGLQAR